MADKSRSLKKHLFGNVSKADPPDKKSSTLDTHSQMNDGKKMTTENDPNRHNPKTKYDV